MKILYAIQGTGNGHLSRARDIIPLLGNGHEVDLLTSGCQADVELPFEAKYKLNGLGFIFGKKGGVDLLETYKKSNLKRFIAEINELPVQEYDLVINDFEPVSAWACFLKGKKCIALSHQAAVLNKHAPRPKRTDLAGRGILKRYAPASKKYGFHFREYDEQVFTPVIRQQVREQQTSNKGHYTVYLPAYDDKRIIKMLQRFPDVHWQVFSKHNKKAFSKGTVSVAPIDNDSFIESMASAEGVLCGAGFETPAEALFMQKKLLVVPMKNQYEQQCNAAALKDMGVPVIKSLKVKHLEKIQDWISHGKVVPVDYPDITAQVITKILADHSAEDAPAIQHKPEKFSVKAFRKLLLEKGAA